MNPEELIKRFENWLASLVKKPSFMIIVGVLILFVLSLNSFFTYIKPNELGIKQVKLGLNRGIQDKVYEPGYHFLIPMAEVFHTFPRDLQVFDLTNQRNMTTSRFYDKAAHIQTSDGFFVDVDVSVIYRIEDPLTVIKTIGPGELYFINGILPKTEPALKETLGMLTTEEFYKPELRVSKMMLAEEKLREELIPKGIYVEHVLIRQFKYSPEIQRNIEEKKLKDQLVYKNKAEARVAIEEAALARIIEKGEATIKIELERGNAYEVMRDAEKELYSRTKRAKGDLLVKTADALKTKLKNAALQGVGAENLVGLEMANVLDGVEVIILPSDGEYGFNPLHLEKTRMMFD